MQPNEETVEKRKDNLRKLVKRQCRMVTSDYHDRASRHIMGQIETLPEFVHARTAALFWPLQTEADIRPLIRKWCRSKNIVLPVMQSGELIFRSYRPEATMTRHKFGVWEPRNGAVSGPEEIELIIVPGLAFDTTGGRLGYGKGFYDRYLGVLPAGYRPIMVGLCFDFQLLEQVPSTELDIKMDRLIVGSDRLVRLFNCSETDASRRA